MIGSLVVPPDNTALLDPALTASATIGETRVNVRFVAGHMQLKPIEYWVEERTEGPWWRRRVGYYLACEFSTLGPFDSRGQLYEAALAAGIRRFIQRPGAAA